VHWTIPSPLSLRMPTCSLYGVNPAIWNKKRDDFPRGCPYLLRKDFSDMSQLFARNCSRARRDVIGSLPNATVCIRTLSFFIDKKTRLCRLWAGSNGSKNSIVLFPERFEPSSRNFLIGEQPNPWDLLQPQDKLSRHRGAELRRRYGLLGGTSLLSPG